MGKIILLKDPQYLLNCLCHRHNDTKLLRVLKQELRLNYRLSHYALGDLPGPSPAKAVEVHPPFHKELRNSLARYVCSVQYQFLVAVFQLSGCQSLPKLFQPLLLLAQPDKLLQILPRQFKIAVKPCPEYLSGKLVLQ